MWKFGAANEMADTGDHRVTRRLVLLLGVVAVAVLALGAGFLIFRHVQGASGGPTPVPPGYAWRVTSGSSSQDLQAMDEAVRVVVAQHPMKLPPNEEMSFEGVSTSGDWAVTSAVYRDSTSNAIAGGEGATIILRKVNGQWRAAYPHTPDFAAWLPDVPDELIAPETKQLLQ
jgi:hypothetical protein